MSNVEKDTQTVVESDKSAEKGSTPTQAATVVWTPRQEVENTLNYLTATYNLLQTGLFDGKSSNVLIQVKAWLENQQKAMQLQLAKLIAADASKEEKSNG